MPPASITLPNLTRGSLFDSLSHIRLHDVQVFTQNQDHDTRNPSLSTGRFILDFVVDSTAIYKKVTKEKKDLEDPYAISTCSNQLLSSKLNLHIH